MFALGAACAAVLLLAAFALVVEASPPPQSITADEFWQQVDSTLALVEENLDADSAKWLMESKRWSAIGEVIFPGQLNVRVDTSYIERMLNADPPMREELASFLTALKRTRAVVTQPDGAAESELLRQILARPEFQNQNEAQNFLQRILQWLADAYNRLIDLLFGEMEGSVGIPVEIVIPVTAAILLGVLVFIFRDSLRNLFSEVELAEESAGEGEILSSRLASQKAGELSGSGDYRHALRYLYLSALLLLDERGLLRYNRAQTNREYLRQVRARPELAGHLKEVVDTFDRVWYGFQPLDEAEYKEYARHVTALEETKE